MASAASSERLPNPPPAPPVVPAAPIPPPPQPPGGSGFCPGAPKRVVKIANLGGVPADDANDQLLAEIRTGVSLKPTKTKDRSSAVIRRRGNFK